MPAAVSTRSRILDRAIALASVDGLGGLTLGRLADDVGMSKSGLFAHFRSKEELQLQVLDETIARFQARVIAPAFRAPRGEARLRALYEHWVRFSDDPQTPGGCLMTQVATELDDQPGAPRDRLADVLRQWRRLLADAVRLAIEVGDFRADTDPEQFAFQMQGIMLARHQSSRLLQEPDANERSRRAFDALVAAARPARAP
jgi:AcrR family transcriptional regulator